VSRRYAVKELFFSLCGEGGNTGRPAVFARLSGCPLWSGLEADRGKGGSCSAWCDTDFRGTDGTHGGRYAAPDLAELASSLWPGGSRLNPGLTSGLRPLCVLTGGEPMLQVRQDLISALHSCNFEVAVETNGTIAVPPSVDWITVSPKAGTQIIQRSGAELKLAFPQSINPSECLAWDFARFYLQPIDGPCGGSNHQAAVAYCLENPRWRLSLQAHKILGLR
jgi:7-carboxy-7-deazaguanine synthase (Cx14CxxC type)